jgi:hypothetical protein
MPLETKWLKIPFEANPILPATHQCNSALDSYLPWWLDGATNRPLLKHSGCPPGYKQAVCAFSSLDFLSLVRRQTKLILISFPPLPVQYNAPLKSISQPAPPDRCKSGTSENNSLVAERETSSTSCYRQRTLLHGLNDPLDTFKGQYVSDASISVALFACSYSKTIDAGCVRAVVWPCSSSASNLNL